MYRTLFLVLAEIASSYSDLPLPAAGVLRVLTLLVDTDREEIRVLESIHEDVRALVEGPYRTGLVWLEDAAKPHRSSGDRHTCLMEARRRFMDAYGQERHPLRRALIEYRLGLCWLLIGSRPDAKDWLEKAHSSADQFVRESIETEVARLQPDAFNELFQVFTGMLKLRLPPSRVAARGDDEEIPPELLRRLTPAGDLIEAIEHLARRAPGIGLRLAKTFC
jgi:hypothetical protein